MQVQVKTLRVQTMTFEGDRTKVYRLAFIAECEAMSDDGQTILSFEGPVSPPESDAIRAALKETGRRLWKTMQEQVGAMGETPNDE